MALSATTELNKYMVKKRKTIQALTDGIEKLFGDSVERGFVLPQGNLVWNLQELTVEAKRGLTEANVAVVTEQIDLEIEITTKEYQLQIEQAKINWDIEKTELLNDFAIEIAQMELMYDLKEEDINEISLQIENRKSILLIARTDLQVAIEALNKQLAEIDATTVGYEVLLINARIATNTEKLKIIPYLQQLIVKEDQLLVILKKGMTSEYDLIEAKKLLIQAKKDILPYLTQKAIKRGQLADAQYDQAIIDLLRVDLLLTKIENDRKKTDAAVRIGDEDLILSALTKQLTALRNDVEQKRITNSITHIAAAASVDQVVNSWRMQERTGLTQADINSASILRSGDSSAFSIGQTERGVVEGIEVSARIGEIDSNAGNDATTIIQNAEIDSKADVTSKLIHLVGSV